MCYSHKLYELENIFTNAFNKSNSLSVVLTTDSTPLVKHHSHPFQHPSVIGHPSLCLTKAPATIKLLPTDVHLTISTKDMLYLMQNSKVQLHITYFI